jgi:hypothetical protein
MDAGYIRPGLAAVHLIVEEGRVAVVEIETPLFIHLQFMTKPSFSESCAQKRLHFLARFLQCLANLAAESVNGRGIAKMLGATRVVALLSR